MSITSALSSALSGLSATSRQAEILSSNVANATTAGYARREVQLSAAILGGTGQGVAVTSVSRDVDRYLLTERRHAQSGDADRSLRSTFLARVEQAIGTPETPGSLGARLAAFDQALIEAQARPDSQARLAGVATTARALAAVFASASTDIQRSRVTADRQIAAEVGALNAALAQVHDLNTQLRAFTGAGHDISALLDNRQQLIDGIAAIVPIREVPREMNQIALFTTGGAPLLEGTGAELGFSATGTITPEMTQALGGLSGLEINGRPIATSGSASSILGGRLGALFALRDELAVTAQRKLDAVARDLVERFSASGLDPTLASGDPGLFTDDGGAFLAPNEAGLAGRIRFNVAADPSQGGALYRLRDGLAVASEGPPGNAGLLGALHQALSDPRALASAGFTGGTRSFADLASDLLSDTSALRLGADAETSYSAARLNALTDLEDQNGIDTDQEMQMLLVIERNYAANAKVIQTVNDMIDTLIRLGA